ncbi:hypothetical protein FACS1894159_09910 [Bacteroidia bacterium]|nr:hypothetical protein FACS1894159_09910 [Bacteroidia bacterium]
MKKKKLLLVLFLVAVAPVVGLKAQYNKFYFFNVGRNFLIDNQYENAIRTLNILLKVDPKAYEGYFLRGVAKYNLDDLLGAEDDFSHTIFLNPVHTTSYHFRAITRAQLGNYEDALSDFREALELRPDLPGPYYSRGVTYLLSKQYDKAIADFDQFIRHENKVADAYLNRGTAYLMLKDTTRAYDNFDTAIRTNRDSPSGYTRRGALYMEQRRYPEALTDFNMAIVRDTTYLQAYFNRAIVYSNTNKPMLSLSDFDRVIRLDSTSSLAYFNRAIMRTQIGDYNRALDDYDAVARYSPGNVLVYFNRAMLYARLGDLPMAIKDYDKAISLYPDFATAYLNRSQLRYYMKDLKGSRDDQRIAERKIAEYRSRLSDSTFSSYADTSRRFNQLLSFGDDYRKGDVDRILASTRNATLQPLFKFTLLLPDTIREIDPHRYYLPRVEEFIAQTRVSGLRLSNRMSDLPPDSLVAFDKRLSTYRGGDENSWHRLFERGIVLALIRQYTSSIAALTAAIEQNPANPFLYLNRSTVRSEMIDFISSIDNSYQRITVDSDPVSLKGSSSRTYSYDEAIADLNKAAKLFPEMAHIYYNRANLLVLSGKLPEAYDDYTEAIRLNPGFAESYYNRGLVQIFLKDIHKGCLDLSKAGELGIKEAYTILKQYSN